MYETLVEGTDNNEFEPEEQIPNNLDPGNLHVEYGIIKDDQGNEFYKDEDVNEELIPQENRL